MFARAVDTAEDARRSIAPRSKRESPFVGRNMAGILVWTRWVWNSVHAVSTSGLRVVQARPAAYPTERRGGLATRRPFSTLRGRVVRCRRALAAIRARG